MSWTIVRPEGLKCPVRDVLATVNAVFVVDVEREALMGIE